MSSLCDICAKPGNCCTRMRLWSVLAEKNGPVNKDNWGELTAWKSEGISGPWRTVLLNGLPFIPIMPVGVYSAPDGREYQTWSYRCTNLLPNGRCGDYENRPDLCKTFAPLADTSCFMLGGNLLEHKA